MYADRPLDPHSPMVSGKFNMMIKRPIVKFLEIFTGLFKQTKHLDYLDINPFLDPNTDSVFAGRISRLGPIVFLLCNLLIFGWSGILLWAGFVFSVLVCGYTIADGVGHLYGYRNYNLDNASKNFFPIGIVLGGEELHNNHHADSGSANFARRWYEFDIGYRYIQMFEFVGLAKTS